MGAPGRSDVSAELAGRVRTGPLVRSEQGAQTTLRGHGGDRSEHDGRSRIATSIRTALLRLGSSRRYSGPLVPAPERGESKRRS
jgi:hypothetical protein